jgi:hypothetical protein
MRRYLFASIIICSLVLVGNLAAQTRQVPTARYAPTQGESPQATAPFAQFGAFDYDTQMWNEFDLSSVKKHSYHTGFFLSYDRVYASTQNPQPAGGQPTNTILTGQNYHWANRYYGGWVGENDKGIQLEYMNWGGFFYSQGLNAVVPDPFITETNVQNFELNRIFREKIGERSYFEPYFGFRYMGLTDNTIEDTTFFVGATEIPDRFIQQVTNSAGGAQIGVRLVTRRGRITVRTDSALTAAYNRQRYTASDIQQTPGQTFPTIFEFTDQQWAFVPALDLSLEFGYNLSRDIALRLNTNILYLWDGVNRANTATSVLNPNSILAVAGGTPGVVDQSFFSAGFGFGIEWRR